MISWLDIPRFYFQDLKLIKKTVIVILCAIPIIYILGASLNDFVQAAQTFRRFALSLRFEFFYCPLFILMLGMHNKPSDWIIIRRFTRRGEMALCEIGSVLISALLFTLFVILSGILVYCSYGYPFSENLASLSAFVLLFYLVIVMIGLLFVSASAVVGRVLASIAAIALVVLDRFTAAIVPLILYDENNTAPLAAILVVVIVLLSCIIVMQSNGKDYYVRNDRH